MEGSHGVALVSKMRTLKTRHVFKTASIQHIQNDACIRHHNQHHFSFLVVVRFGVYDDGCSDLIGMTVLDNRLSQVTGGTTLQKFPSFSRPTLVRCTSGRI
jgi:hypothetical protein